MTVYPASRSRLRSLLCAFALVAIVVRGFVPAGYMFEASAEPNQFITVAICHGDGGGTANAVLDLKNGKYVDPDELPGQSDPDQTNSCPYAMTAFFSLPVLAATLDKAVYASYSPAFELALVAPGQGLAAPPPPPRAPPLTI
ncbi:DUF2946 family protein [Henriciella litoralis]|uniref:DUF2946 family protein n=1 Tax=Henriciella litoralis TaxID=568102 RepID=UPI002D21CF2F|nr:DUF2946 family protein [Henriciella litoralis]